MCFSFFSSASHYSWMEQSKSRRSRGTERNGKIGGSTTRRGRRGTRSRSLSPKCGGTFEIYFKKTDFLMWNVPSAAFRERMSSWWIRQIFFCDFFFHRFFHISVTIYINFRWKKTTAGMWEVTRKKDFFVHFYLTIQSRSPKRRSVGTETSLLIKNSKVRHGMIHGKVIALEIASEKCFLLAEQEEFQCL